MSKTLWFYCHCARTLGEKCDIKYKSMVVPRQGETVLIIGTSGGIGTALLQLGQLAGLKIYGLASGSKHEILERYGAEPIDYHHEDYLAVIQAAEPAGIDAVLAGVTNPAYIRGGSPRCAVGGWWSALANQPDSGTCFLCWEIYFSPI